VYRSPNSNMDNFINGLESYYNANDNTKTNIFIGDVNCNILNETEAQVSRYLDTMYSYGFVAGINEPTRVTNQTSSCLDHMFFRHFNTSNIKTAILKTEITDHFAILSEILFDNNEPTVTQPTKYENSFTDYKLLKSMITNQSWEGVFQATDTNESTNKFFQILSNLIEKSKKTSKCFSNVCNKITKPWITEELRAAVKRRDKMSKKLKKQPFNTNLKNELKQFRNQLSNKIKQTKAEYYREKINEANRNPKAFWKIITELIGKPTNKNDFPIHNFIPQNCCNPEAATKEVASSFNKYFTEVGQRLADDIGINTLPLEVSDEQYIRSSTFCLRPINEPDVINQINKLGTGTAPGYDNINSNFLKENVKYLAPPLVHIYNLSLESGIFPQAFKLAKVIPLHKSGNKDDINNFRPISLLSVFSKVLEKLVKMQLSSYLSENNIITNLQFGFRSDKSITDALFNVAKTITESVGRNKRVIVAFLDLAKAFDSVDRSKLIQKLSYIGILHKSLDWFSSYLSDREQIVSINRTISETMRIDYGVIQGSTLGPLLFLIYINNISKLHIDGRITLFADDTAIFFEGDDWPTVYDKASRALAKVKNWFDQNTLTLNLKKTKYMTITANEMKHIPNNIITIHSCKKTNNQNCNCEPIERVKTYKYLGVIFDDNMKWNAQIIALKQKLRKFSYIFYQLGSILSKEDLRITYFAYVQSLLIGGIIVWGGANKTIIQSLEVTQKSIIKAAMHKNRLFPTNELYHVFDVLSIRQLYVKYLLCYAHKNYKSIFSLTNHLRNTRNTARYEFTTPRATIRMQSQSAYYIAHILYKKLPDPLINNKLSQYTFKLKAKAWIKSKDRNLIEKLITSNYRE
jgi:hypothetical protein